MTDILMGSSKYDCSDTELKIDDITKISKDITDFLKNFQTMDWMRIFMDTVELFGVDLHDPFKTIELIR